jgi:hypothetical protein
VGEVINFNQVKVEKQYQQVGSLSINLALDNVKYEKHNRNIKQEMIKSYMKLLSK